MSTSIAKGLRYAVKAAQTSTCPNFRVGAALLHGSRVLGVGRNFHKKTSPNSTAWNKGIHAEYHCLSPFIRQGVDISGAVLFVARVTKTGLGIAKPCEDCQKFLIGLGLKCIYFTDRKGNIDAMWFD